MIANRIFKYLGPTHLVRLSSSQVTKASETSKSDIAGGDHVTSTNTPAVPSQQERDDDLYRYLWLRCRAHDNSVLDSYEKFLTTAASHLDIEYVKTEAPFRTIKRRTMLASRFVKKKYRVQYEIRTHYRDVLFKNMTGSTADTFLEYVERNLPEGVMMIAERHKLAQLPFDLVDDATPSENCLVNDGLKDK